MSSRSRSRFATRWVLVALLLALLASACSASEQSASDSAELSQRTDDTDGGWVGDEETRVWESPDDEALYSTGAADAESGVAAPAPEVDVTTTAGSVDDNELWDEYLLFRQAFDATGIAVSRIPVEGRQIITVEDAAGNPIVGADVSIVDSGGNEVAHLRTYSNGKALFHAPTDVDPDSQSRETFTAVVSKAALSTEQELPSSRLEHTIVLDGAINDGTKLDVLFLVDATGSMSDEIERLKANMISIAEQLDALPAEPDVRFGMTVYRDRGEAFVTRTFDFTGDVVEFTDAINEVVADAGGDTPESLNAGLHEAITVPTWRDDDTVKLVFLVADAPPHLAGEPGYEDEPDYAVDVVQAAARGIKIFPIASSGLDDQGEYVFRQLAQITMARFVFLTYGPDGSAPGETTPHSVAPEDYDVLPLDGLVVQLVTDELAPLGG